jgi:putative DNA primase/helicase
MDGSYYYFLDGRAFTSAPGAENTLCYAGPTAYRESYCTMRGSLAAWQWEVAEAARGNPLLVTAMCAAFGSLLLGPSGEENSGIHIYGNSTSGKTTMLQVGASVLGGGGDPTEAPEHSILHQWHGTPGGIEALAAMHHDQLLLINELGSGNPGGLGSIIYTITGGLRKSVLGPDRVLKHQDGFRTVTLSCAEEGIEGTLEQGSAPAKAGQLIRVLDIPVDAGMILDRHGLPPSVTCGS